MIKSQSKVIAEEMKLSLQNHFVGKGLEMINPNSYGYAYDLIFKNKKGQLLNIQVITSQHNSMWLSPNSRKKIGLTILDKHLFKDRNSGNEYAIAFPESFFSEELLDNFCPVIKENGIVMYFVNSDGHVKKVK